MTENMTENLTRDEKILKYWRYAAKVARNLGLRQDDISIAAVALIKAVDGYDPDRNATLQTYITFVVRRTVRVYLDRSAGWNKASPEEYQRVILGMEYSGNIDELGVSPEDPEKKVCDKDMVEKIMAYAYSLPRRSDATCNYGDILNSLFLKDLEPGEVVAMNGSTYTSVQKAKTKAFGMICQEFEY